jgi:hypothetical protein
MMISQITLGQLTSVGGFSAATSAARRGRSAAGAWGGADGTCVRWLDNGRLGRASGFVPG